MILIYFYAVQQFLAELRFVGYRHIKSKILVFAQRFEINQTPLYLLTPIYFIITDV